MSDMITEVPTLSPAEQEAVKKLASLDSQKLVNKLKYLGMHMETMDTKEKLKYSGQFDGLTKSLGKLRRILRRKLPNTSWQWTVWICIAILILIYG